MVESGDEWGQMLLTGTYQRSLDEKRRLAVPKRVRDAFGGEDVSRLFIAPGTERSLDVYSPAGFERLARRLARKYRSAIRDYLRLFYSQAEAVDIDSQGRIRIPDRLAEFAQLEREVVLLGVHDHAEIWSRPLWEQFLSDRSADFDDLATQAFE